MFIANRYDASSQLRRSGMLLSSLEHFAPPELLSILSVVRYL